MSAATPLNKAIPWAIGIVVAIAAGAAYYFWQQNPAPTPLPAPIASAPVPPTPQVETPTHYPVPLPPTPTPAAKPLPELNDSDTLATAALAGMIAAESLKNYLIPQEIVRHIVVTADNLPRKTLTLRLSPVKPVGSEFLTTGREATLAIAAGNSARYVPNVRAAVINAKLREIRRELTGQNPKQ